MKTKNKTNPTCLAKLVSLACAVGERSNDKDGGTFWVLLGFEYRSALTIVNKKLRTSCLSFSVPKGVLCTSRLLLIQRVGSSDAA
ncbi:hypothetical protein Mapa_010158 [Marchantia paleacea]|nr:hypothetical protein Mapa_010158 [Marchantia paleacea]